MFIDGHTVYLGWLHSTDDLTPAGGLSYNLRIGTSEGAQDVMPAMANSYTGKHLLPQTGNMGNNTDWVVNLPDGTYFWSVQAIDHSFAASGFSWEQTFTILNVGVDETAYSGLAVFPNPVADVLTISGKEIFTYEICFQDGRVFKSLEKANEKTSVITSDWLSGVYLLKVNTANGAMVHKLIKQ
jgi:hypothetical protein